MRPQMLGRACGPALRLLVALSMALCPLAIGAATAPAARQATPAAERCTTIRIAGKAVLCVRAGQRCDAGLQRAYVSAGLQCTTGRLRPAGLAVRRHGEAVITDARGRIDPRGALEAFDVAVASLPGVTPRPGAVGRIADATSVVAAVGAQRDDLTPAQRRALDRALTGGPRVVVAAVGTQAPASNDQGELQAWRAMAVEARQRLAAHGFVLTHTPVIRFMADSADDATQGFTVADWLWPGQGARGTCTVSITPTGRADPLTEQRDTLVHELFHCVQFEKARSLGQWRLLPQWVKEGGASWVAATITEEWSGVTEPAAPWSGWLRRPEADLGIRTYTALGFFALLQQTGVDVFARMPAVVSAGLAGGDRAAYAAAIAGAGSAFPETWGGGLLRQPDLGPEWDYKGPRLLPASEQPHIAVGNGTSRTEFAAPRGARGLRLDLQADVVNLTAAARRGIQWGAQGKQPLTTETYCTRAGGCDCPGRPFSGKTVRPGTALPIGWIDGYVNVTGRSVDDQCAARDGIMVIRNFGTGFAVVARFRIGDCTVSGGTFRATSSTDEGYALTATIRNFTGVRRVYRLRYRARNPTFTVTGPGGPYTNVTFPERATPPRGGGGMAFPPLDETGAPRPVGSILGLGFVGAFNPRATDGVTVAGVMACRRTVGG